MPNENQALRKILQKAAPACRIANKVKNIPKGVPLELAQLRNTVSKSRVRLMPRVKRPLGSPPEDISPRMKAIWEDLRACVPDGLLGEVDRPLVEAYCTATALQEDLAGKLQRNGKPAHQRNECARQWGQLVRLMIRLGAALGISPEARSRMNAPAPEKAANSWGDIA
jgi:phage terminase small subunit